VIGTAIVTNPVPVKITVMAVAVDLTSWSVGLGKPDGEWCAKRIKLRVWLKLVGIEKNVTGEEVLGVSLSNLLVGSCTCKILNEVIRCDSSSFAMCT